MLVCERCKNVNLCETTIATSRSESSRLAFEDPTNFGGSSKPYVERRSNYHSVLGASFLPGLISEPLATVRVLLNINAASGEKVSASDSDQNPRSDRTNHLALSAQTNALRSKSRYLDQSFTASVRMTRRASQFHRGINIAYRGEGLHNSCIAGCGSQACRNRGHKSTRRR